MDQNLLIANGFVDLPAKSGLPNQHNPAAATLIANLSTFGYTLDREGVEALMSLPKGDLANWWKVVEPVLSEITGANRNMGDFIVYKNFPREVLDMTVADSILRQIAIYHGMPYEYLVEEEDTRPPLGDVAKLKVLRSADETTQEKIFANLMAMPNRWSDNQKVWAEKLIGDRNVIVVGDYSFRENGVVMAAKHFSDKEIELSTGTDVLRLCAALSDADVSLREKIKLRSFKRPERRKLLAALNQQANLEADMAERPGQWKRLMERLRPGDYEDFARVSAAYDDLYNGKTKTFGALVDPQNPTVAVLDAVVTRPGEFLRRFHHLYDLFGSEAVDRFIPVVDKLSNKQLAGFRGYLNTINDRMHMIYAPKSNWARAKVEYKKKKRIDPQDILRLDSAIGAVLRERISAAYPEGLKIDPMVEAVKLQTNDQKLAEYGRGTQFDIPKDAKFVRSASYWAIENEGTTWYDNGWNFFDTNWQSLGTCAWNAQHFSTKSGTGYGAIYSGDPVNSRDLKGRACQMADLYLDRLAAMGVRFAVWNVLCYSQKKFSEATEVLATLQWGEDAESGKTYEPSRAQMVFPLKSETLSSYVAYLDIEKRKLVYMDVAFPSRVSDAGANSQKLQTLMPAYVEYLEALPSVLDLVRDAPEGSTPVLYEDERETIEGGKAFVFRSVNPDNKYDKITVTDLVGA